MSIQTLVNVSTTLRDAHPDIEKIFTRGGCFEYFRMLNIIEPRLEPYYITPEGHVAGCLNNTLIDINGVNDLWPGSKGVTPMTREPRLLREAAEWKHVAWEGRR